MSPTSCVPSATGGMASDVVIGRGMVWLKTRGPKIGPSIAFSRIRSTNLKPLPHTEHPRASRFAQRAIDMVLVEKQYHLATATSRRRHVVIGPMTPISREYGNRAPILVSPSSFLDFASPPYMGRIPNAIYLVACVLCLSIV